MNLKDLTKEEIKEEIIKKILYKIEADKAMVDRQIKYCEVYKHNGCFCLNFYNGFEFKVVSINQASVVVSSESLETNINLSKYYQKVLSSALYKKAQEELVV